MTKTVHDILRARLLEAAGVFSAPSSVSAPETLEELMKKQWNEQFVRLMKNRMCMGYFRYGSLQHQKRKERYDSIGSSLRRLRLYQATGNLEHLVDAANLCLIEFTIPNHPNAHFDATDDGVHAKPV